MQPTQAAQAAGRAATLSRPVRIMLAQLKHALKCDEENLIPIYDEADVFVMRFLAVGLPHPYRFGEYLFQFDADKTAFPQKPPNFSFLTSNGFFIPGGNVCVSIGAYHPQNWRAAEGMVGYAREIVGALLFAETLGSGIGVAGTVPPPEERARIALGTVAENRKKFPRALALADEYEAAHPAAKAVAARRSARASRAVHEATPAGWAALPFADAFGPAWDELAAEAAGRLTPATCGDHLPRLQKAAFEYEPSARRVLVAGFAFEAAGGSGSLEKAGETFRAAREAFATAVDAAYPSGGGRAGALLRRVPPGGARKAAAAVDAVVEACTRVFSEAAYRNALRALGGLALS